MIVAASMKDRDNEMLDIFCEADEVLRYFTRGKRFVEELLRENERLRYKILHLEQELAEAAMKVKHPGDKSGDAEALREQLAAINARFESLKKDNEEFRSRHQEVEVQNENLLNLYVSSYQLHASFREESVREVIREILLNLVGAEVFALWLVNQESGAVELAASQDESGFFGGGEPPLPEECRFEHADRRPRHPVIGGKGDGHAGKDPLAVVPLHLEGRPLGCLAIYKLLEQKANRLTPLDHDLLGLLASQAGAAVIGSMLFKRLNRELKFMPGSSDQAAG